MRQRSVSVGLMSSVVISAVLLSSGEASASDRARVYRAKLPASALTRGEAVARRTIKVVEPKAPVDELVSVREDAFAGGDTIVAFEQKHHGIPVIARGATVLLKRSGNEVVARVAAETNLPSSTPRIDASEAARVAGARVRTGANAADAHLVYFPVLGELRLAWAVVPPVPFGFASQPRVIVDAQSGDVIEARDMVVFANSGKSYQFNPVSSPTVGTYTFGIAPEGNVLSNAFIVSQNCIDQKSVKPVTAFGFNLSVHLCDLLQKAKPNGSGDYLYDPVDDPANNASRSDEFSEVSMYYHVTKAYQFFRTLQGDLSAQVVTDKPLRTISNLQIPHGLMAADIASAANPDIPLDPFQNAFFSPAGGQLGSIFAQLYGFSDGAMWFGQGPTHDYSYDGDVVYHEFGHAVVDKTLKLGAWHVDSQGAIDAPGAMNEGLADYFSSAITGDPKVGEYASKDISPAYDAIRNIDNTDSCPGSLAGEVHFDSTLFTGGLWTARSALSVADRSKFDAALYKAMRMHAGSGDLGYEDLVQLFLDQLATDLPAGKTELEKAMTARGVLPSCDRTIVYAGEAITAPGGSMSPGSFAAPAGATLGIGSKTTAPGLIQIKFELPENTKSATVSFDAKKAGGASQQASSVLGGSGTFEPVVLAKFDAPIVWTTSGAVSSDAELSEAGQSTGTTKVSFTAPKGAKALYVQIANAGQADGAYDNIAIEAVVSKAKPKTPTDSASGSDDTSSLNETPGEGPGDGGGCATANPRGAASFARWGALIGLGLLLRRRGRRSFFV